MKDIMNLPDTEAYRKDLRNCGTSAEATLWKLLKNKQVEGLKFRRQHSVGCYILDFYCSAISLGIELDGEVHVSTQAKDYDERRSRYLMKEKGIMILRFENRTVFENPSQIVEEIKEVMRKRGLPTTSPCGYSSFQKEESGDTQPLIQEDTQPFIQKHTQPLIQGSTQSLIQENAPSLIREEAKSLIDRDSITSLITNNKL